MSDFKKLIDGLPIVFRGKSEDYADEGEIPIIVFRESDYLALMDEAEQRTGSNQVPDETISSTGHQNWLEQRRKQNPLDPEPIGEQKLAWEPGMVLIGEGQTFTDYVRLDELREATTNSWLFTSMINGAQYCKVLDAAYWKVHRLPHEFRVGDWFATEGVVRQMVAIANKKGWIEGNDGMIYDPICCHHVPPQKEVMAVNKKCDEFKRNAVELLKELADADTEETRVAIARGALAEAYNAGFDHSERDHRAVETSENPFKGPHWDALDYWLDTYRNTKVPIIKEQEQIYLRQRDLRDELLRMRGGE